MKMDGWIDTNDQLKCLVLLNFNIIAIIIIIYNEKPSRSSCINDYYGYYVKPLCIK